MNPLPALLRLLLMAAVPWSASAEAPGTVEELFHHGNALYEAGDYAGAAEAYEQCVQAGGAGADVLYNLGNAHARQQQVGRALAAYHAALRISPRDVDVHRNLGLVAALRTDTAPRVPPSWTGSLWSWVLSRHTLSELTAVALLWAVLCTVLGVALLLRRGRPRRLQAGLCVCGLAMVVSAAAGLGRYVQDVPRAPAFISVAEATLRAGPGEHFEAVGTLADGGEVLPLASAGDWQEVALPTGKRGWLPASEVALPLRPWAPETGGATDVEGPG